MRELEATKTERSTRSHGFLHRSLPAYSPLSYTLVSHLGLAQRWKRAGGRHRGERIHDFPEGLGVGVEVHRRVYRGGIAQFFRGQQAQLLLDLNFGGQHLGFGALVQ